MKKLYSILVVCVIALTLTAQTWHPVGSGVGDTRDVLALISFNGNLIAGGDFRAMGANTKTKRIGLWNGTSWQNMGAGFNDKVRALAVYNNELYAGGRMDSDSAGNGSYPGYIAKWNGIAWVAVSGADADNTDITAMYVFNGKLYVTNMHYDNATSSLRPMISVYDGNTWSNLPGDFKGPENYRYLYAIGEYKGKLVVGGVFDSVGNVPAHRVATWDGSKWEGLNLPVRGREQFTPTVIGLGGRVHAIKEYGGKLFLGGIINSFVQAPGDTITPPLVSWNDTMWTAYRFDQNIGATIHSLDTLNGKLYVTGEYGYYDANQNLQGVCDELNAAATPPFNPLKFYNGATNALDGFASCVHNDSLYVAGKFSHAGNSLVNNIARLNPAPINTSVVEINALDVMVYPNPATSYVTIENQDATSISITNTLGGIVTQADITSNKTINVALLSSGIYFYEITTSNKQTAKGRLMIQH